VDPIPEVRTVAARALGSLIKGMGEENFKDLVPWILETLKSENSSVERSGAAQGLSEVHFFSILQSGLAVCLLSNVVRWFYSFFLVETSIFVLCPFQVLAALGTAKFESLLPGIIADCSHPRAAVRDGHLTVFKVRKSVGNL
jgi:hypothetical protein